MSAAAQSRLAELDGELAVGGVPASRLAAEHGTPLYVYDAEILRERLALLRAALTGETARPLMAVRPR